MTTAVAFDANTITDEKRLARGEQFSRARWLLRARDGQHHRRWKVLMTSGGAPEGAIRSLRSLMPKCAITAVDIDQRCLDAAITAGADDVVHCDLEDFQIETKPAVWNTSRVGYTRTNPPQSLLQLGPFDLIDLDLCAGVSERAQKLLSVYGGKSLLSSSGVLMLTFSYGRDVVEQFKDFVARAKSSPDGHQEFDDLISLGVPQNVAERIAFLFGRGRYATRSLTSIDSIICYRGHSTPMCSLLVRRTSGKSQSSWPPSFIQIGAGDFELAVTDRPDPSEVYDCPQDRIEALRRKHAALKAVYTRSLDATKGKNILDSPRAGV